MLRKHFKCDIKITKEMEINEIPSLVFFNENIEEEGVKISGYYPYHVYEEILGGGKCFPFEPVSGLIPRHWKVFLKHFDFVASKEIAVVYDMSINEVEKEMKKLQLKQIVEPVYAKYGTFWKYIKS